MINLFFKIGQCKEGFCDLFLRTHISPCLIYEYAVNDLNFIQVMYRSQIKRAPDDFFQLRRFKDFRHPPDAVRFQDILLTQSQIKGAPDGSFFGNAVRAPFISERHRTAPGRTSVGDRTDIGQQPDGARRMSEIFESAKYIGRRPDGHRAATGRRPEDV